MNLQNLPTVDNGPNDPSGRPSTPRQEVLKKAALVASVPLAAMSLSSLSAAPGLPAISDANRQTASLIAKSPAAELPRATSGAARSSPSDSRNGYTCLESYPSSVSSGAVAWALVFDWDMNAATSGHVADAHVTRNTLSLLGSALLLGGRPLAAGRRRRKTTAYDYLPGFPDATPLSDSDDSKFLAVPGPRIAEENSEIRPQSAAPFARPQSAVTQVKSGDITTVSSLGRGIMQVCHWLTARTVTGTVAIASAILIPTLFTIDCAHAAFTTTPNNQNASLTADASLPSGAREEWKVDGVDHSSGAATWFWYSVESSVPQSLDALITTEVK